MSNLKACPQLHYCYHSLDNTILFQSSMNIFQLFVLSYQGPIFKKS